MKKFLPYIFLCFALLNGQAFLYACDDSSAEITAIANNGDGTYTLTFDVCIEFNGLEGNPDAFSFNFNPSGTAVQSGFSPTSIMTSSGDVYSGARTGNTLSYSTNSVFTAHCCPTICDTYSITVQGLPESVLVITHEGNAASACNILLELPGSPCECGDTASCDGIALADESSALAAYNAATSGCYDLSLANIPADDGLVYEFCFEYTHTAPSTEFAFNSRTSVLNVGDCIANSMITRSAYEVGVCGSPLVSTGTTADGWFIFNATMGNSYRLCTVVDTDELECCGNILSICTFAYPFECVITASASGSTPVCEGDAINFSASGGSAYTWSGPGFASPISGSSPSVGAATISDGGTYSVTVSEGNGCSDVATVSIIVNANPTASATNNGPLCQGEDLNLSAAGGVTYNWSGPTISNIPTQNITLANAMAAQAGTYSVTVTDANGCTDVATTVVSISPSTPVTASNNGPVCEGETIELMVTGGTSWQWTGPNSFSSTLQNPTISAATAAMGGVYTVTAFEGNCFVNATTTVLVNTNPTATVSNNSPICEGEDLILMASGGVVYNWTGPGITNPNGATQTISNAALNAAGIYTVIVTNSNGCTDVATTNAIINSVPTASASSNSPICETETLQLSVTGGTSWQWTGPNSFSSTLQNPMIVNATSAINGTYQVTISQNGCTDVSSVNVVVNDNPTATISGNSPICEGETLNLTASGGGTYTWSGPGISNPSLQNQSLTNALPNQSGTYNVIVTNPNGCVDVASTNVVIHALPNPSITNNSPVCAGDMILLNAVGGTSWQWSGPNGFSTTVQNPMFVDATPAMSGTYMVTITENNCSIVSSTEVLVNETPVATANTPSCEGEDIFLMATGGTSYNWSGPNGFISGNQNPIITDATPMANGDYNVTVTDDNGCSNTANIAITVHPTPTASATYNAPISSGDDLLLSESGGEAISWNWTGPNGFAATVQNPTLNNIDANGTGLYIVSITDANGCMTSDTAIVILEDALIAIAQSNSIVCEGSKILLYEVGGNEGTGATWAWTGPNGFTSTVQNPAISFSSSVNEGTYTVVVTDTNGNTATDSTPVIIAPPPLARAGSNAPICEGSDLMLTETAGFAVSWNWISTNGFTSTEQSPTIPNATAALNGVYFVTITDANGCTAMSQILVEIDVTDTDDDGICDAEDPEPNNPCVPDDSGCGITMTVLLEGPYINTTGLMRTDLANASLIPLAQPYHTAPWNYPGIETITNNPPTLVDWILVELRDPTDNTIVIETKAALLLNDGSIVSTDWVSNPTNTQFQFTTATAGNAYYLVVRHRNHLDVISANAVTFPTTAPFHFSEPANINGGTGQLADLGNDIYGLFAGDFNGDGVITVADYNIYQTQASAINQYVIADCSLDKSVTVSDFNLYQVNASQIGVSPIRY